MSVSVLSAYQRLQAAEVDYLVKSGWERVGATQWARRGWAQVKQEDAVRLQKQHDHSPPEPQTIPSTSHWDGRPGHTRRLVVEVTDKGAVHYEQVTDEDAHQLLGTQTALELGLKEANTQRERGDALMREVKNQERRVAELEEKAGSLGREVRELDTQLSITFKELATERTQGRQERHRLESQLLAGDMSVVRNSLDQANSELREAQEILRRMEEDKSATVQLLKQSLERILNRMADMASVERERR